jgi:WD40 repeat protein
LASGQFGDNADVCLYDFETKNLIHRLSEHDHGISSIGFTHDEKLLVTVGDNVDKRMLIWDLATGGIVASTAITQAQQTLVAWGGHVRDIKRRETKNYQLATSSNNKIIIWNLDPHVGELTKTQINTGAFVRDYTCLVFAPSGDYLYAGSASGDFSCISVRNFILQTTCKACSSGVQSINILSSGQSILVGGGDSTITAFNGSGKDFVDEKRVQLTEGSVTSISLNGDETRMLAGTSNGDIYVVQTSTLKQILLSQSHKSAVLAIEYPRDVSDKFATISQDGVLRYWDATDYSVLVEAKFKGKAVPLCIAFVNDIIIAGFNDGSIKSVDSVSGEQLWESQQAHRSPITSIGVANNDKFFVSGGQEGELRIWAVKNRELVQTFKEHRQIITDIVLFGDDMHMLSSSRDRSIFLWDLKKERRVSDYNQRIGGVNAMVLCQDGKTIISVGTSKQIMFWDIRQAEPTQIIEYHSSKTFEPTCIAISHNNRYFAVGGTDQRVNFYDVDSGKKIAICVGHSGTINKIKFSPDDKQLVSVGEDGSVFVWNIFQ